MDNKEKCRLLLVDMQERLNRNGIERFPKKSDFTVAEVCLIKNVLGPWPRALEAAGIKQPKQRQ